MLVNIDIPVRVHNRDCFEHECGYVPNGNRKNLEMRLIPKAIMYIGMLVCVGGVIPSTTSKYSTIVIPVEVGSNSEELFMAVSFEARMSYIYSSSGCLPFVRCFTG